VKPKKELKMLDSRVKLSKCIKPFGLRLNTELKDVLKEKASNNGRSLNAEIIIRLRDSLELEVAS
jgi:hypothetical protein